MITFEYNGRIYKPSNLEKKLKSMGISKDDIKIIEDKPSNNEIIKERHLIIDKSHYYCFWNKKCKGWYDSKVNNINDWPWDNKEDFVYIGEMLENESLEKAHTRLFKLTFSL